MKLGLHRAEEADWDKAGNGPHNFWQKIASKSYGTLTPANVASIAGGVLAIYGLLIIVEGEITKGLLLVAVGRLADLVDGLIAEYTRTKSPLGEIIDASMDKLIMAFALIVFVAVELVPWPLIAVVAAQNIVNVMISVLARLRNLTIHPSRMGKLATAFSWATLLTYPLGEWLRQENHTTAGWLFIGLGLTFFGLYLVLGLRASLSYGSNIKAKKVGKRHSK